MCYVSSHKCKSIYTIGSCCHLLFLPPTTFTHLHFPSFHIWHKSQERSYHLGPPQVVRTPISLVPCLAAPLLFRFILVLSPLPFFLPPHSRQLDRCQAGLIEVLLLIEQSSLRYSGGSAFFGSAWLLGGCSVGGCSVVCKFFNHGPH